MHTATTGAPPRGLNGGGHVPPPVLAPSPPMSTCRRLSYDSVVSGRCSRSRTRGSSSVSSPARSHSRSTPPPAQQPTPPPAQQQRHFWQTHAPVTEVSATVETVTTVARTTDDAVDGRSPSVDHGAAAAAMKARAQALVMYRRKLAAPAYDHASSRAVVAAEVCEVSDDGRGVEVATDSVVAASHDGGAGESSPSPPAASPPPRRRVSAVRCSSDGGGPARQPHRTRSASSSGGVGGAGGSGVGVGGPSPFAVEQLALPRRRPHLSQWTSNTTGGATKDAAQQLLQQRAPPVQLVGPADRRRGAAAAGGVGVGGVATTSTALAASHLPGAAATQDRLQQQQHQQRSRLTRTLSAASASTAHSQQRHRAPSAGAHRGARSPSASRALTTGGSGSDSASTQEQGSDRRGSHPRLRQRSSTPSGGVAVYTTRGASCSGRSPRARGPPASPTHADPASDAPAVMMTRRGVVRSSSAPVSRHATSRAGGTSGSSGAVPVSTPRVAVARVGAPPQVSATPREHVRTASVASVRHHRYQPDTSADTGPVPPPAISSLVQRRSRSRDTGGRSVQRGVVEHSTGVSAAAPLLHTARPVMHAGAGGPRARPVVSTTSAGAPTATATAVTTTTTAAVTRRATARLPRHGGVSGGGGGGHHTISATPASMISMEESKAFLQDFQRLNQRELALFDTLLATVAAEQQQHQRGAGGAAASPAAASPASASFPAGDARHPAAAAAAAPVSSVDEVSVWTCKRDAAAAASAAVASDDGGARRTGLHRHANGVCALPLPATGESPAALADDEELVVVVRRSRSRSAPSAGPPAGTRPDAGLPSRCVGVDAVAPEPRSPSPVPIPPASVGSTASPNARPPPGHDGTPHVRTTTAAAATRGGLRPRAAADVNAASNVPAASCVRKAPPMSAAAACGARRGANALSRAAGAAVDVAVAERPARQRSVTSYAEMKPSVSPDGAAGRRGGGCRRSHSPESDSHAETGGGAVAACAVTPPSSSSVSPADAAAPPLAALKRVKERAAQQAAAAARVKAAAAAAAAATVSTSASSASVFSCAGSPVRCSPSADRGCTGAGSAVVDVSGVRVTAAQLQLLIDGSRSHANLQRYAPL
ncbi:hypothetical protein NESM_000797400 [Novymonas esmeraldas]|uniref:Uncharacterized protein n=1 Tax=Novymonas esmeraldas TaxID=1808958 RepID=A0AAW0EZ83_9TRYP